MSGLTGQPSFSSEYFFWIPAQKTAGMTKAAAVGTAKEDGGLFLLSPKGERIEPALSEVEGVRGQRCLNMKFIFTGAKKTAHS